MEVRRLTKIARGQDGAVWGSYLFRFQMDGSCHVYDLEDLKPTAPGGYQRALCCMDLDKTDRIVPHANSVFFGTGFYDPMDEFPLLYVNIYNNYDAFSDRRLGQCCVYRVRRQGNRFETTLVQLICIAFTQTPGLWCSEDLSDIRPYGNFLLDRERQRLYAYTMVDDVKVTRYFGFRIPGINDGTVDPALGVPVVELTREQILEQFDCPYQNYLQGACCHNGIIYSLEGLADNVRTLALTRVSLEEKRRIDKIYLSDYGFTTEPELIDFYQDTCIYADNAGNCYAIELK